MRESTFSSCLCLVPEHIYTSNFIFKYSKDCCKFFHYDRWRIRRITDNTSTSLCLKSEGLVHKYTWKSQLLIRELSTYCIYLFKQTLNSSQSTRELIIEDILKAIVPTDGVVGAQAQWCGHRVRSPASAQLRIGCPKLRLPQLGTELLLKVRCGRQWKKPHTPDSPKFLLFACRAAAETLCSAGTRSNTAWSSAGSCCGSKCFQPVKISVHAPAPTQGQAASPHD